MLALVAVLALPAHQEDTVLPEASAARTDKGEDWLRLKRSVPVRRAAPILAPSKQAAEVRHANVALDLGMGCTTKGGLDRCCFWLHVGEVQWAGRRLRLGGDENTGERGAGQDGHTDGGGRERRHVLRAEVSRAWHCSSRRALS